MFVVEFKIQLDTDDLTLAKRVAHALAEEVFDCDSVVTLEVSEVVPGEYDGEQWTS